MPKEKTAPNPVNDALRLPLLDAFEQDLAQRLEEAGDAGCQTIAMADLDRLLKINEAFGHAGGDKVLIATGESFRAALPRGASLYRYGGDAFAVIFPPEIEKEDAFLWAEELRRSFGVKTPDGAPVTVTIGIASAPEDGTRAAELVRKADGAMYRGKVNGSNRVCLAREEKMVTKTSHYTVEQLQRLTKLSKREGVGEAILLREAMDSLLKKYDV